MNRKFFVILLSIFILVWSLSIPSSETPEPAQAETTPAYAPAHIPAPGKGIVARIPLWWQLCVCKFNDCQTESVVTPASITPPVLDIPAPIETPEPVDIPESDDTCPGAGHCWRGPGPHPSPVVPWADPTPEPEQPGQPTEPGQNQSNKGGQG